MHYLTAGESHGDKLVCIVDDVPSGIALSEKEINFELKRRSSGPGRSSRQDEESNTCKIVSGVNDGKTTGNPVCVEIENSATTHEINSYVMRPGHGDLPGVLKHNFDDSENVDERTSARETAARLVAGVIAKNLLANFDVEVYGYVSAIGSVKIKEDEKNLPSGLPSMSDIGVSDVLCPDAKASQQMLKQIDKAAKAGDSLGGAISLVAVGALPGLGCYSQGKNRLDSKLAAAVMSVPSVKNVSVGSADFMSENLGSASQDTIRKTANGIAYEANYCGGIEAGMTNGMPVCLRAKVKPVPTLKQAGRAVDLETMSEIDWATDRRSDVCVVPNVAVVCESEMALVLANAYLDKFGCDTLSDIKFAVDTYRQRIQELN